VAADPGIGSPIGVKIAALFLGVAAGSEERMVEFFEATEEVVVKR
jgi:hypothetical protein